MLAGGVSPVRADVIEGQGVTEVIFRRRDRWKSALKLIIFGPLWLFGGLFAVALLGTGSDNTLFLSAWLALWIPGGLIVGMLMLWGLLGVESLIARSDSLTIMRRLLVFKRPIELPAATVTSVRWVADDPSRRVRVNNRIVPQPFLEISCDGRQVKCARLISEAEADLAIAAVKQRLAVSWRRR